MSYITEELNRQKRLQARLEWEAIDRQLGESRPCVDCGDVQSRGDLRYGRCKKCYREWSSTCFYCGIPLCGPHHAKSHVDHLVPVSRGGTDDPVNLVKACERCNLAKGDWNDVEFFTWKKYNTWFMRYSMLTAQEQIFYANSFAKMNAEWEALSDELGLTKYVHMRAGQIDRNPWEW